MYTVYSLHAYIHIEKEAGLPQKQRIPSPDTRLKVTIQRTLAWELFFPLLLLISFSACKQFTSKWRVSERPLVSLVCEVKESTRLKG